MGTRCRGRLTSAAVVLLGLAGIGLTAACGTIASAANGGAGAPAAAASATSGGAISEAGSTLLQPLMAVWASAYKQATGVTVKTAGGGSTLGIDDASSGAVDIGASDAYLSSGDVLKNPSLLNIPLAISAQSIIYNLPEVPQTEHIKLTGAVLADMYNGTITMWDDPMIAALNGGIKLPAIPVVPLHRYPKGSGDTFIFTSYLSTQDATWNSTVGYGAQVAWPKLASAVAVPDSVTMYQKCGTTRGCVGYNGVSYLAKAQAPPYNLGEAALQNGGGHFTTPTGAAIQAEVSKFIAITPANETIAMIAGPGGDGYPIVNYEYAIVSIHQPSAAQAKALKAFLTWVVTTGNGSSFLGPVGFQPLSPDIQTLSKQQIERIQ
ncbi:MAG: periplasmic phosphate-binding lipoprotein pstS1 [Actinomycetia bacterium]|nr:periplasmic phosphate-binding lipoprotein pstS1 [Actinomycetes bacterium]